MHLMPMPKCLENEEYATAFKAKRTPKLTLVLQYEKIAA
jgi:hypothetical protein